ncbi:MAG: O-methyltransferase [Rickettsiales bacterium]|nr:O-methyltransferase [Rickettsiales bacterium]
MRHDDKILDYIRSTFAPEDEVLQEAKARLSAHDDHLVGIQVGAEEGKLLQFLIKLAGVASIVEIGSLAGYSAVWMARALPQGGVVHAINKDKAHYDLLCETVERSGLNIQPHLGDANAVLQQLETEAPFDMVFIDADKGGYTGYLDWAEKHVRKGGLIVGDNSLLFGHVIAPIKPEGTSQKAWVAMREFNQRLADESRYESILIPTAEGLTVARKLF